MRFVLHSFSDPAENLAYDEALLDECEQDAGAETLRFWESNSYFVVLGSTGKMRQEVDVQRAESQGIPVLRRVSGGGTVLQGPGCLNFTLTLRLGEHLSNITQATKFVMERVASRLSSVTSQEILVRGISDLVLENRKFSGNAQRRRRRAMLHHGTILYQFDISRIGEFLLFPEKVPEYRQGRSHEEFVTNFAASKDDLIGALREEWGAGTPAPAHPSEQIARLVAERYSQRSWNWKF